MSAHPKPSVTQAEPFIAVEGQYFSDHRDWVRRAEYRLTAHPQYNNTEHGDQKGWRGSHFTALCFDQKGRRCLSGGDMRRADEEGAFPVWWVWPDQIAEFIMATRHRQSAEAANRAQWPTALLEQSCCLGLIGKNVIIDCETRAEAEEVLDWLCGERHPAALSASDGEDAA